ncbi:MAG TPA: hypothetical protein VN785_06320, partial [Candidatus Angelobacter sp.]|nr:hypothetical protein [Candidatus Angelobacter sp.]
MKSRRIRFAKLLVLFCFVLGFCSGPHRNAAAQGRRAQAPPTPGPMLSQGTMNLDTPDFDLVLVRS